MFPTLLKVGPVTFHSYGLMIAVGFLAAFTMVKRDARKQGIDPQFANEMWLWALLWGIAGTRILHIIMFPDAYSWKDPLGWIAIWRGGLVFQGALPPAILYGWYYARKHEMRFWTLVDLIVPYIPLAHAFGRVGCFLNGCCYGKRTELPWGISFPRVPWNLSVSPTGSPAYLDHCRRFALSHASDHWSYPVHPTQLYSVAALLCICATVVLIRDKWHPFAGVSMPAYFTLYGAFRFFVEFLRGDHNPTHFGAFSDQQVFSLLLVAGGLILFSALYLWDRPKAK
ncbi:MAG TPA: prolipoprotein diacylglyceryl transferase [Candidatus Hydrogenedentes bacterium]|nr:prolipoprotein diacylglyceryl transferase [Candidatus Hydrogenedentota bacterium]